MDTRLLLFKLAKEIQNTLLENEQLQEENTKLRKEVEEYHNLILRLGKRSQELSGDILKLCLKPIEVKLPKIENE